MKKIIFHAFIFLFWCNTTFANCVGNCTDGFGTYTDSNGDKYEGMWKNDELNSKWEKIKKIRDEAYISIENKRANKIIGSSLEANISIKLKENLYNISKNEDFSEICITSYASIVQDDNIENDIEIVTEKAEGNKCPVCWKISKSACERHGHLKL